MNKQVFFESLLKITIKIIFRLEIISFRRNYY